MSERLQEIFPQKIVPKGLALRSPFDRLPRYVAEYLIAKFAPHGDPQRLDRLAENVLRLYPTGPERNRAKDQLLQRGHLTLIDELRVKPEVNSGRYVAEPPTLADVTVQVPQEICQRHPATLYGLWGTLDLRYHARTREVSLAGFIPFEVVADLEEFLRARKQFREEEWIDLLLQAVGLNPAELSFREKQLSLARLAPLVEPRLHLIELGPRQTGKSFLLRNTSPEVFLVSSSKVTPATLFYHQVTRQPGLVGVYPVIVFDEIAYGRWSDDELLGTLKDFMESGRFSRGGRQFSAQASLVFLGNSDDPSMPQAMALPRGLAGETGFLDRLNGWIPGHELPKIAPELLYEGPGLAVDFLAEIFRLLRKRVTPLPDDLSLPRLAHGTRRALGSAGSFRVHQAHSSRR
ncbi:MAG: hypothetical protein KatS3mg077_0882 [Candidatus Binatia bacterium]|nr:MAG: hypothetical protein KatS3mg077_0882 [Candidatus Binatia bacterium]